ncbi:MAG TPA: hypothetical protein VIV15_13430 [Anaerolineales bacterium]
MWAELDAMEPLEQFKMAGAWIDELTHVLSPALGERRRDVVVQILAQPGWDYTMFAEMTGSRRQTIKRLAEEARTRQRERDRRAA